MLYVKYNAERQVEAVASTKQPGWEMVDDNDPQVRSFLNTVIPSDDLEQTDLGFVRVLEDVIDILIDKGIFRFTDLPFAAQQRLSTRRSLRVNAEYDFLIDNDGII